jgi:hypothetical protein
MEIDVVTSQIFSWKDSGNQQENLLVDMVLQTAVITSDEHQCWDFIRAVQPKM